MARLDPLTGKPYRKHSWSDDKYRTVVKQLRRYAAGFGASDKYDLRNIGKITPARKRRIKKYGSFLIAIAHEERKVYRPKTKKRLNIAKRATGMPKGLGSFTVAFPHVEDRSEPAIIKVTDERKSKKTGEITTKATLVVDQAKGRLIFVDINKENFITDYRTEITRAVKYLNSQGAYIYSINVGSKELTRTDSIELLLDDIGTYIYDYGVESVSKWLLTLQGTIPKAIKKPKLSAVRSILQKFKDWKKR